MEERKVEEGLRICEALFGCQPGSSAPAQELLASISFLNLLRWIAPGGFSHLRSGWDSANESGAMGRKRAGTKGLSARAAATEELRNDMAWRSLMLESRPVKKLQFRGLGGFAWRPRLPNLPELALSLGEGSVVAVYSDASRARGWNATMGAHSVQGKRPGLDWQSIIWRELWVLREALVTWAELLAGKLVLARMQNGAAAAYANYGAGRAPHLAMIAR